MRVSFDPKKDEMTGRERGFSLDLGKVVIASRIATFADLRRDYGETRYVCYGYVEGRLHVCVYTLRGETFHIISLRKANDREVKKYGR